MYEDPPAAVSVVQQQQQQQQQQQHHLPQTQQTANQQQQSQHSNIATTPVSGLSPSQTSTGPATQTQQQQQQQQQQHITSPHHQQQASQSNSVSSAATSSIQQQQQQQQQNTAVASSQPQIVAPTAASVSPSSVSSQPPDMSLSLAHQLHIPAAIRPGFETEASAAVKRHPHPWPYESDGFSSAQYHHASQYYLDRERKPGFYGYPETPQFQPYWNYREQPISAAAAAYMSASDDRHASVSAAAAARQSVEGTSQSSYETPTYSSPGGLRAYPSDAYASTGKLHTNKPKTLASISIFIR
uniref:Uncharacterized protein n=1 Tax=Glossina morsitans morsitans TaxID=37546 RepID=A0A1B0FNR9_GLOMM